MPGSEKKVIKYLHLRKGVINLRHIGVVSSIKVPSKDNEEIEVTNQNIDDFSSSDATKKADIIINNKGVSVKEHKSFLFNRIQRKDIFNFLKNLLGLTASIEITNKLDKKIIELHNNDKMTRNININSIMNNENFKVILKYLMLEGSPMKRSTNPAELIMINNKDIQSDEDICLYTFDEFLNEYSSKISFAIRRQWYGQKSKSEGKRAKSIISNKDNAPWVFDDVKGSPEGWDEDIKKSERKTCYIVFIELR